MIGIKKVNPEVYVAEGPLVQVDQSKVNMLRQQAKGNPRQRARICAHRTAEDRLHEMLIVLTKDVYIRPHKHINKTESFHVIDGTALILFFDEAGGIEEVIKVGDFKTGQQFYFRNDGDRYHTQIITSDSLVFHEVTNGPFNRNDTLFAPWAPDESNVSGVETYLEELRRAAAARGQ